MWWHRSEHVRRNNMLYYGTQNPIVLIGSKTAAGVRTGVELEATYSATEVTEPTRTFPSGGYSKATFDINYTMGAAETTNSIEVKIESSPDRTNWYRLSTDTTSGGTSTLAAREWTFVGTNAAAATINIILDIAYKFMRISVKETGVSSAKGNVFVELTLSGQ